MSAPGGAAPALFSSDPWLAESLGCPVYRLALSSAQDHDRVRSEMLRLAADATAFFYAKTSAAQVNSSLALQRAGFGVIDTAITLQWDDKARENPTAVDVAEAQADHGEAIARIAESCFVYSRFHLDPQIPPNGGNLIKRRWIENYTKRKRGSALYAAMVNGEVAGFLAVIESGANGGATAAIDLIGVSPGQQGAGIGTALVQRFIRDWRARAARLQVGTQAANIPSLRLYQKNGFRVVDSTYVLHAHVRNGQVLQ